MEVAELRRRLRAAMEAARQGAAERRTRRDQAAVDYAHFLQHVAVPLLTNLAAALTAEGHPFKLFTPAGSVRLSAERAQEEFIELLLDDSEDPPQVLGRTSRGRGRRMVTSERPVSDGTPIAALTEDDVLSYVLQEIAPFVER